MKKYYLLIICCFYIINCFSQLPGKTFHNRNKKAANRKFIDYGVFLIFPEPAIVSIQRCPLGVGLIQIPPSCTYFLPPPKLSPEPLCVVNGTIRPMNINPSDIIKIRALKGDSKEAARYGRTASLGGVIIITTKHRRRYRYFGLKKKNC
jgi:hypothetical protein